MWALSKDPADRPQTAAEFSRALHAPAETAEGQARRPASVPSPAPPQSEVEQREDRDAAADESVQPEESPSRPVTAALPPEPPPHSEDDSPDRTPGGKWRKRLLLVLALAVVFVVSATAAILFLKWRGQSPPGRVNANAPPPAAQSPTPSREARVGGDTRPETEASPAPAATPEKKEPTRAPEADKKALQSALTGWVAATNSRDVKSQLSYYAPRLEVFYLSRNVSREAVLKEKRDTFGRASRVSVSVADPTIEIGRDGLTAVMKFRKRYVIESGGKRRAGEVMQELLWSKARSDRSEWKITGERDLQVIR
jgi:hypothetical protein